MGLCGGFHGVVAVPTEVPVYALARDACRGCRARESDRRLNEKPRNSGLGVGQSDSRAAPPVGATCRGRRGIERRHGRVAWPEMWGTLVRCRRSKPRGDSGLQRLSGGEAGIRTLGRGYCPFNGLANRRLQPLGHLTAREESGRNVPEPIPLYDTALSPARESTPATVSRAEDCASGAAGTG